MIAPGRRAIADPRLLVKRLSDYPIDGVYVYPLRLDAVKDSVEKLVQYVEFLRALAELRVPVIAARVGAFGLVLGALGVAAFDSGLGQAEACDLASLNRAPSERELAGATRSAGPGRRVYLEALRTTLPLKQAKAIFEDRTLRSRFACPLGCCRQRGFDGLLEQPRPHYLWARHDEIGQLRRRPSAGMRVDLVHEQLREARGLAYVVRRAIRAAGEQGPGFDHLDRWLAVLAREGTLAAAA